LIEEWKQSRPYRLEEAVLLDRLSVAERSVKCFVAWIKHKGYAREFYGRVLNVNNASTALKKYRGYETNEEVVHLTEAAVESFAELIWFRNYHLNDMAPFKPLIKSTKQDLINALHLQSVKHHNMKETVNEAIDQLEKLYSTTSNEPSSGFLSTIKQAIPSFVKSFASASAAPVLSTVGAHAVQLATGMACFDVTCMAVGVVSVVKFMELVSSEEKIGFTQRQLDVIGLNKAFGFMTALTDEIREKMYFEEDRGNSRVGKLMNKSIRLIEVETDILLKLIIGQVADPLDQLKRKQDDGKQLMEENKRQNKGEVVARNNTVDKNNGIFSYFY